MDWYLPVSFDGYIQYTLIALKKQKINIHFLLCIHICGYYRPHHRRIVANGDWHYVSHILTPMFHWWLRLYVLQNTAMGVYVKWSVAARKQHLHHTRRDAKYITLCLWSVVTAFARTPKHCTILHYVCGQWWLTLHVLQNITLYYIMFVVSSAHPAKHCRWVIYVSSVVTCDVKGHWVHINTMSFGSMNK